MMEQQSPSQSGRETLLKLSNIDKSFPGVKALSGASLTVYAGKVMALLGENGAGKSTLMKVLTGIYSKDAGTIEYLGKKVQFQGPKASQDAGIGIIHQELNLISELSIAENIFLGREFTNRFGKIDWKKLYREADKLLQRLNVQLSSRKLVAELSIGDQQMVEIAKALSFDSKVIIMDEPTDALTDTETASLFTIIRELTAQNVGIVYISHRLQEIFEICDDVTVLRDGQFITEKPVSELTEESLIEAMVGRKLEEQYPRLEQPRGELLFDIQNLTGNGVEAATFQLYRGEILGISGLMGSGRTELMKMIYGALPREGEILHYPHHAESRTEDGTNTPTSPTHSAESAESVPAHSIKAALNAGIVYISEDRKRDGLILAMSVKENMTLTALKNLSFNHGTLKPQSEAEAVHHYINAFKIRTPSPEQEIGFLSGGNQQKVSIAKGLLTDPQLLILDEPTRGVDVGAKKEIYELINQFKREGLSIILISSDMPEVLGMSDRILVMHEGRINGEFLIEEATQEKLMAAAVNR